MMATNANIALAVALSEKRSAAAKKKSHGSRNNNSSSNSSSSNSKKKLFNFGKLNLQSDYERHLSSRTPSDSYESLLDAQRNELCEEDDRNYVVIYNCFNSTSKLVYSYACCQGDRASVDRQVDHLRQTNDAIYQVAQFSTRKNAYDLLAYLLYESRSLVDVHGHCFRIRALPPHETPIYERDIVRHMTRVFRLSSFYYRSLELCQ